MEQNNNYDQKLQAELESVKQAVQGEIKDALFYNYLISMAPTSQEKVIISAIKEEDLRHSKQFERIYRDFTGIGIEYEEDENFQIPNSYLDGIQNAMFEELRDVVKYRSIRRRLPEGAYRDILFDIITDELMHASIFNHLFTLNSNMKNLSMNNNMIENYTNNYNTNSFTLDDWAGYIIPLVNRAQLEASGNTNPENLYRKYILAGVLLGLGMNPEEAIDQIQKWKKTGTSKLLE